MKVKTRRIFFNTLAIISILYGIGLSVVYLSLFPSPSYFPSIESYLLGNDARIEDNVLLLTLTILGSISLIVAFSAYLFSFGLGEEKRPRARIYIIGMSISVQLFAVYVSTVTSLKNDTPAVFLASMILLCPPLVLFLFEFSLGCFFQKIGKFFYNRRKWDTGLHFLSKATVFNPADRQSREICGITYWEQRRFPTALKYLEPLRKGEKASSRVLNALADIHYSNRDWDNAIEILSILLRQNPQNDETIRLLADVYAQSGDERRAVEVLSRKTDKTLHDWKSLANFYLSLGDFPNLFDCCGHLLNFESSPYLVTKEFYLKILSAKPYDEEVLNKLVEIHFASGDLPAAIQYMEQILNIQPERRDVRDKLIAAYRNQLNYSKLQGHLKYLIDNKQPVDSSIIAEYCDMLINEEEIDQALQILQLYEPEFHDDPRIFHGLAAVFFEMGDYPQAEAHIQIAYEKLGDKEDLEFEFLKRKIEERTSSAELERLEEMVKNDQEDIELRFELIDKLVAVDAVDRVSEELDRLLSAKPDLKPRVISHLVTLIQHSEKRFRLIDFLADLHFRSGEFDRVFQLYEQMSKQSLEPDSFLLVGFEKIVKVNPDHIPSLEWLVRDHHHKEQWDRVIEHGKRLADADEKTIEDTELFHLLFDAYAAVEEMPAAETYARKMLEANPHSFENMKDFARFYVKNDKPHEALELLLKARDLNSQDREIHTMIKQLSIEVKKDRLEMLKQAVDKEPDNYEACYELADLLHNFGELDEAIAYYQKVVPYGKYSNVSRAKIALCLARKRIFDLSEETLADLNISDEQDVRTLESLKAILFDIAIIFEEEDFSRKALEIYKKVFRIDAGFRNVVNKIEQLS